MLYEVITAIFGMYGVFVALLTTNLIEKSARKSLLISIGVFVFYNLANGLKGGIDNAAHRITSYNVCYTKLLRTIGAYKVKKL